MERTMNIKAPIWTHPVDLGRMWPTQVVTNPDLRYSMAMPMMWERAPELEKTAMYVEELFHGFAASDLASFSFMPKADPSGNIRNWVDGTLAMAGFPIVSLVKETPPQMMEWAYEGNWPEYAKQLGLDECHTYQGLARIPGPEMELARMYFLLARRGSQAWKITFSILSACLPGTDADTLYRNDHVRAGASFGTLKFL
jgi:hypothetical protein